MPHQTDVTERQANHRAGATLEERNRISALYEKGRPNDVGRAFGAVCGGRPVSDSAALVCLKSLGLVDSDKKLTAQGARIQALVFS